MLFHSLCRQLRWPDPQVVLLMLHHHHNQYHHPGKQAVMGICHTISRIRLVTTGILWRSRPYDQVWRLRPADRIVSSDFDSVIGIRVQAMDLEVKEVQFFPHYLLPLFPNCGPAVRWSKYLSCNIQKGGWERERQQMENVRQVRDTAVGPKKQQRDRGLCMKVNVSS